MDSGEIDVMQDNTLTPELRDKVFKNELIRRDRIFDYVFTCDNKVNRTYGLVEHSWLDYVTDRLRTPPSGYSDFIYFDCWEMSDEDQNSLEKSHQVQKFLDTWASDDFPEAGSRVPFFNLDFSRDHDVSIKRYEVRDLIKCLMRCGNGVYTFDLDLSGGIDYALGDALTRMDFVNDLDQLDLPNLKVLDLIVCPPKEDNRLFILLLPPIFFGCKQLTRLHLQNKSLRDNFTVSRLASEGRGGKSEYLPNTLENIQIDALMTSQLLSDLLLKNSLSNLTELQLKICKEAHSKGVVSSIMERFSRQLVSFTVHNSEASKNENTFIKFPVMTKLKKMSVIGFHSELELGMEQSFPALETLKLHYQSRPMMGKWTENFKFSCVNDLEVVLSFMENTDVNFTLELSQQIHVAFPHVQILLLYICGQLEDSSIQTIFKNMTQLRKLSIHLVGIAETTDAYIWDATILGVSPEYAKNLAKSPREVWNSVNLDNVRSPSHSIINLSNLNEFALALDSYEIENDLLISDVSFQFAFLRMPNLKKLELCSTFKVSKEMWDEWYRKIGIDMHL